MVDTANKNTMLWQQFKNQEGLSDQQLEQFKTYYELLVAWNENINLTTVTRLDRVIPRHFEDSLYIGRYIDFSKISTICDVGTGGGFPGIPLKIRYPHLSVILIEVTQKKVAFLNEVIQKLGLPDIEVYALDWRTFLRTTSHNIDLFFARASLAPDELVRMFKPGCVYKFARLVYWASDQWQLEGKAMPFFEQEISYTVGSKKRRFIIFKHQE